MSSRTRVTKLFSYSPSTITVSLRAEHMNALGISPGDRAELCVSRDFADSFLVLKAPVFGLQGYMVGTDSPSGEHARFTKSCSTQLVDVVFRQHSRKYVIPDRVEVVDLDENTKALALTCPEVAEYLRLVEGPELTTLSGDVPSVTDRTEDTAS